MDNVMLDLETWGCSAKSVVTQIAAVYFDPRTGEHGPVFHENIDAQSELDLGFTVDANTVEWWMSQAIESRQAALGLPTTRQGSLLTWRRFNIFLRDAETIWCHASFDGAVLREHLSHLKLTPYFGHRAIKDLRTLQVLSGAEPVKGGTAHDALNDCKNQIEWASPALRKVAP